MAIPAERLKKMWEGPALKPPPGQQSNFIGPPSLTTEMLVVEIIFLAFATLSVILRFYMKIRIHKKVALEDRKFTPYTRKQLADSHRS